MKTRAGVDDACDRIYLTLLGHADKGGLVTQCGWTQIMDWAGIARQAEVEAHIRTMVDDRRLRVVDSGTRSPHFQLLGTFATRVAAANRFMNENSARVNTLRNARSETYNRVRRGRTDGTTWSTVEILNLEALPLKDDAKLQGRWRFTIRVPGMATIHDCVYSIYERGVFVNGPRRPVAREWVSLVEFDPALQTQIRTALEAAIDGRTQTA